MKLSILNVLVRLVVLITILNVPFVIAGGRNSTNEKIVDDSSVITSPDQTEASSSGSLDSPSTRPSFDIEEINKQLLSPNASLHKRSLRAYRIGASDVLDVFIFQVDELSGIYQVNSSGNIRIPLHGAVNVQGLTVEQAQVYLTEQLGQTLLKNPQINLSVKEYSSQQITVMGAVARPDIYSIKKGVNVYEMLTMAGGLQKEAGEKLFIKTTQTDPDSGEQFLLTKSVNISDMFNPNTLESTDFNTSLRQMILGNGDSLFVEKAGLVYIDGAIKSPGKYSLTGGMTIVQLLAEAGGKEFTSSERKVRILRLIDGSEEVEVIEIDVTRIRSNKEKDIPLKQGDIVTVGQNAFKVAFKGFFDYVLRVWFLF